MAKNNELNLKKGENILWEGRTHFKILFKPLIIQIFLLVLHVLVVYIPSTNWEWWNSWGQLSLQGILVLLSLIYVIVPLLQWRNATFEVTDKRVIKHWGVLHRHSLEIPLERITSVSVERSLLDRVFGCGTLNFQDASSTPNNHHGRWNRSSRNETMHGVRFHDVPKVLEIKRLVDNTRYNS